MDRPPGVCGTLVRADLAERFPAWVGRPAGESWLPGPLLFADRLDDALEQVARRRGTPGPAVAGASLFEGYVQRVVPPALVAWLEEGRSVRAGPDDVRVAWSDGRVAQVAFADAVVGNRSPLADLMDHHLAPAVGVVHERTGVGTRVLRGAVAHAVSVAFLHVGWRGAEPAAQIGRLREVLDEHGLGDLVRADDPEVDGTRWLYAERRTCCLAFRAGDRARAPSFCATCPVVPESERRRSFREAVTAYRQRHGR